MADPGAISYWHFPEAVRDIFIRQHTGRLTLRLGEGHQTLQFLSGQLYLLPSSFCYERLKEILVGPRDGHEDALFDPVVYLRDELDRLVRDLVEEMAGWDASELRFEETAAEVTEDIVGPVPTGVLVMDLCSRGLSEGELLRRLGGLNTRYSAAGRAKLRRRVPELARGEIGLLDRLDTVADVRTLIAEAGGRASEVLYNLIRLVSVRLIESEAEAEPQEVLSQELLDSISARVQKSLEAKPLEMKVDQHRAWLSKVLQDYGSQSHFELLGVDSSSSIEEIHRRYMELARAVHPCHADSLGFRNRKRGRQLEWLFARLTEGYLVLSDSDRAAEYRRGMSELPTPQDPSHWTRERRVERSRLGRDNYLLALEHVDAHDYHYAIELLRQAVAANPLPEYYALLGDCLRRNPHWLHMSVDSYREAVALRPEDPELRALLQEVTDAFHRQSARAVTASEPTAGADDPEEGVTRKLISKLRRRAGPPDS